MLTPPNQPVNDVTQNQRRSNSTTFVGRLWAQPEKLTEHHKLEPVGKQSIGRNA